MVVRNVLQPQIIVREYVFYVFSKIQKNATFYVFLKWHFKTRKLCCRKDDRAMRPIGYMDDLNFRESLTTPTAIIPNIFSRSFVPIDPMNVSTKFEVRSFTGSWDNRRYTKNVGSPWIRRRYLFSKIFNGLLFGLAL